MRLTLNLRLLALILIGAACSAEARQDPNSTEAKLAKAARGLLDYGKEAAGRRLREAREAVASDTREEGERDSRLALAFKESTTKLPLRVALPDKVILDGVRISDYSGGVVTLTWPQGEVAYPVLELPEDTRAVIVGIVLAKGTPRDMFELGRLLLRGKDYERAGRCFSAAVLKDPSLAGAVPDLDRLKKASRLFEGSFRFTGTNLSLKWTFASPQEAGDFQALEGTMSVQPGTGLVLTAPTLAVAAIKEIPFHNRVRLSALPRETDAAAHVMGIRFSKPDGGFVIIYGALATNAKTFAVFRTEDGKTETLLAPNSGAAGNRMTMEYNRGRVSFLVGERSAWTGKEGGFTDVLAVVGSLVLAKGARETGAAAAFKEVSLQGDVNPDWMAKKTAGLRDAVASEFAKEDRTTTRKDAPAAAGPALSIDGALPQVPPLIQDAYRSALGKVATMRASRKQDDLDEALQAMEGVTVAHPMFAPAWYFRGELEELGGDQRTAETCYDNALGLLPEFPEALCGRGRLKALAGKWREAGDAADLAMTLKPDLADAHLLQARIFWNLRDAASVIEATQIARKLAPADPEIQTAAQQLANVARGPRWVKPSVHESAHYIVRSDLPAAKSKKYAEHLEALRPHYEEVLGRPLAPGKPAGVLIFESEEGYFIYNDFTSGSRREHTLGAYSPWDGQMTLFEGVDSQETTRVLSHEGFHQAVHAVASDIPIWFNEGMAEYVGAARVESGKLVERGGVQQGRLDALTGAVKYGWQPLPFSQIMLESQAQFYHSEASLKYAQAWSMIRYFQDGDGGKWRPLLKAYIARVLKGDAAQAAFDETFAKQNLPELEAGWMKFYGLVLKKKPVAAAAAAAEAGPTDLMAALAKSGVKAATGWTLRDGILLSWRSGPASLDLGHVPPAEYDLRMTVERRGGPGPLLIGLQGGGSTFVLRLDDSGRSNLETMTGPDRGNAPSIRPEVLAPGKPTSVVVSIRKSGVFVSVDQELLLEWKGAYGKLTYVPGRDLPPATKSLFLHSSAIQFQITELQVAPASVLIAGPPPPSVAVDAARSIPLPGELRTWTVDDDAGQILALDSTGSLLQISMAERKVLRKIPLGAQLNCISGVAGKTAWVGTADSSLIRVDLDRGQIADSIPVSSPCSALVIVHKIAYCLQADGSILGIDLTDKRELGPLGSLLGFTSLSYEARKDRLWGYSLGALVEFDGTKIGPILKEYSRKNLGPKERGELSGIINGLGKKHQIGGLDVGQASIRCQVDDRTARIYVGGVVVKADKPETTISVLRPGPHPLDKDPGLRAYLGRTMVKDQILAVSADGKSAASSTFIFNVATGAIRREIPLPTSLLAFSRDGKELLYYDWVNNVIAVTDVDGK